MGDIDGPYIAESSEIPPPEIHCSCLVYLPFSLSRNHKHRCQTTMPVILNVQVWNLRYSMLSGLGHSPAVASYTGGVARV